MDTNTAALERHIAELLQAEPAIDSRCIRVSVSQARNVTLDGAVHTYAEKCSIHELVRGVDGVAAVRNRIDVRITIGDYRTDTTLARVITELLESLARMPPERPRVAVCEGWVTLEGNVSRAFQMQLIERVVRDVAGVRGITNHLTVAGRRRRTSRSTGAAD